MTLLLTAFLSLNLLFEWNEIISLLFMLCFLPFFSISKQSINYSTILNLLNNNFFFKGKLRVPGTWSSLILTLITVLKYNPLDKAKHTPGKHTRFDVDITSTEPLPQLVDIYYLNTLLLLYVFFC